MSFAWNNIFIPESFFLSLYIEKIFMPTFTRDWWPKINSFVKTFLRVHNCWTSCKEYVLEYRQYQISHLNIFSYLRCTFSCAETNSNKIIFCYFKGATKLCFTHYLLLYLKVCELFLSGESTRKMQYTLVCMFIFTFLEKRRQHKYCLCEVNLVFYM